MSRRKALLIGINYYGSDNELQGCEADVDNMASFLISRGFSTAPQDMVVLKQSNNYGPYYPTGRNILAAMDWLVSEPNCSLFLHYSGHGGQVRDHTGQRSSGYDDTICPVDYDDFGQIPSDLLHRRLVTNLAPGSTLFVLFDCCHSGSALELPWVYRAHPSGSINMMDNESAGMHLLQEAQGLLQGGFSMGARSAGGGAKGLFGGVADFLKREFDPDDDNNYYNDDDDGYYNNSSYNDGYGNGGSTLQRERSLDPSLQKSVFMLSGCQDSQTSADAFIGGRHVGAMSWAFLETMRYDYGWNISYVQLLQNTRQLLQRGEYGQVPQLSCGFRFDLGLPLRI